MTGGHIQIEGNAGVNGPCAGIEGTVGRTIDLIGETIGINAPAHAGQRINAIGGASSCCSSAVTASGTTYATLSNGADNTANAINNANGRANNGLAIDATALGVVMTAGQIQVIGSSRRAWACVPMCRWPRITATLLLSLERRSHSGRLAARAAAGEPCRHVAMCR